MKNSKKKLFRISTAAISLNLLLEGQLKYFNDKYDVTAIANGDEDLYEIASREQVKTKAIKIERKISVFKDFASLWMLFWYFYREKPEIVHSISPKAGLLSMIAGKYAGVPTRIHTFTGLIFPYKKGPLKWILLLMDRVLCWHATHIIPEGNGVKNDLLTYNVTKKPLNVIAKGNVNGIDYDYFNRKNISEEAQEDLKKNLGIKADDFVFIFVGRLVGDKGINELVNAFSAISKTSDKVKLLLVGPYELKLDPLKKETLIEIELNSKIITTGFVKDVRPYFAVSNALVFPSYREGFPNVVMQAGAMELPSIVTDINGCNEIIEQGHNGVIIPPKDAVSLQNAMLMLLEDAELTTALKDNARNSILKYDRETIWQELEKEYLELHTGDKNIRKKPSVLLEENVTLTT